MIRCHAYRAAISIPSSNTSAPSHRCSAVRSTICPGRHEDFYAQATVHLSAMLSLLSSWSGRTTRSRASPKESHASRRLHIPHPVSTPATSTNPLCPVPVDWKPVPAARRCAARCYRGEKSIDERIKAAIEPLGREPFCPEENVSVIGVLNAFPFTPRRWLRERPRWTCVSPARECTMFHR